MTTCIDSDGHVPTVEDAAWRGPLSCRKCNAPLRRGTEIEEETPRESLTPTYATIRIRQALGGRK